MDSSACIATLRGIIERLGAQRETVMLNRRMSRADQTAELNRLLGEQAALSYAIGVVDTMARGGVEQFGVGVSAIDIDGVGNDSG